MGKNKLKRFAENSTFHNLFQPGLKEVFNTDYYMKGNWCGNYFKNNNPVIIELGCGRGEYTVEMGRRFPERNFIGIDIKGARIWRGAKSAVEENLANVAFLRCRIEFIESLFGEDEVSEIWITFADPQINRHNKRLTGTRFLERYRKFLKSSGIVHLKTDSLYLHNYTMLLALENRLEIIESNLDIYGSGRADELLSIKTKYETQFLTSGSAITYMAFRINTSGKLTEPEIMDFSEITPEYLSQRTRYGGQSGEGPCAAPPELSDCPSRQL
ncbi:MAG: tRNA (guanosine(46)-N7)-methyltransferase TrmB [Bacteroidales bacterium]|nr:tRNA (guanosine(46)-N7)-methyltransferase TrmB [Bacteroidales bacterium]MDD2424446.1 tRNA (guanosine(46)-N7)-methyltransferase TrmB [Bacteroidales bacterium]MDD3989819.1 tRNA (guanosine(46)-N7)-methyltransferase TrmB [Bacteroidales bacterium]MDD4639390.1 tRNA (guanosine(46)-N7)-methyltransferase TrmB [Bacteroidales bacterium]